MNSIKKLTLFIGILFLAACSSDKDLPSDIPVSSITINNATAITDGLTKKLSVTVLPANATNSAVTWTVSDPTIATISQEGFLTPKKNGTVTVDVTANDASGIAKQVTITISGFTVPPTLVTSVTIGGTSITDDKPQQLTLDVQPANATIKTVTWSVSDSNLATITQTGLLTPKSDAFTLGATITVVATTNDGSGKVGTIQFIVPKAPTFTTILRGENILLWQRSNGGWPKEPHNDFSGYNREQTPEEKTAATNGKNLTDTTIDNAHTIQEIRDLLTYYKTTKNPNYLIAAEKGIDFLFKAQYANGGWPQYYPIKSNYSRYITYNDDAMGRVMDLMWDISKKQKNLEQVDAKYVPLAVAAFNKGIDVILKTQITSPSGKKTAWCAQHDDVTLLPALARAYELPSISGSESVAITRMLMRVESPSAAVKQAIKDAVEWFNSAKLYDIKTEKTSNDVIVVASPGAILWARFYDLNTGLPFFCGRDGIKKATLAEIELERRTGYSWYGNWPSGLIGTEYNNWKTKHGL